ncbi:hypothetical protein DFQ27_003591 [Actinomortierella ambigua]|uniref:CwfJ C-terminus 1-domain-containing protein-like protein n=1 Tax=Actinomortierella ambigua TaxID=1343610 RepID=A0A9P6Q743_9FUNG|nr:hypothetical protein DFQ27_003591 [Actinomortierella ambigua]
MESSSRHSRRDDNDSRDSSRRRHRSRSKSRSRSRSRSRERDRDRDRHHHHKKHRASSPRTASSSSSTTRKESRDSRDGSRSSHKSDRDRDRDRRHHRHDKDRHKDRKRSSRDKDQGSDLDQDDDDMWVEKEVPATAIVTSATLSASATTTTTTTSTITATVSPRGEGTDGSNAAPSTSKRAPWMLEDSGGLDFGMMGTEKPKKPKEEKPDPEKLHVSSRELNVHLKAGLSVDQYPEQEKKSYTIGDAGSNWRMTKLRRVLETAAEEGVSPQVIGIERYGSLEKFNEAMEERRELDRRKAERDNRRNDRGRDDDRRDRNRDRNRDRDQARRGRDSDRDSGRDSPMSTSTGGGRHSAYSSAASSPFHRPMEPHERQEKELARRAMEKDRERKTTATPIPSPFATIVSSPIVHHPSSPDQQAESSSSNVPLPSSLSSAVLSQDALNKLKAKALRAKLMGTPDADKLEKEYEAAEKAAKEAAANPRPPQQPGEQQHNQRQQQQSQVVVISTLAHSSSGSASPATAHGQQSAAAAKKRAYGKGKEATHDALGNRTAYEGEEGDVGLQDLVLRERLERESGGMDREYARRITRDAKFQDDVDYLDEHVDKIARTVKRTDKQLKDAAVYDFKRTQGALDQCQLCFKDDGRTAPLTPVVSLGSQVYLGLPLVKEFLPGQCLIVPLQHVTSTLELDDDAWDEIRNFMKCLIQMHAAQDRFVIFSETVLHPHGRSPKHTAIECYPIPWQAGQAASGYFKEAILGVAEEWSQHKKIIETNAKDPKNGGVRRRLTSKMPYFHVWCFGNPDRGYGHVIEDDETKFPDYFVREVLASACEMDSWEWQRKPKRIPVHDNDRRVQEFKRSWQPWDWTRTLDK